MAIVTPIILFVDDCQEDQEIYRNYLLSDSKKHNYKTLTASTGKNALLLCGQKFPDVIVMDAFLPDMDCFEFFDNLKAQKRETFASVIILTNRGNEQIAVRAIKGGAADYLVKKYTTSLEFIKAVEKIIERQHGEAELRHREQKLAVSEEQYRFLFERNPNPMWIFDPETLAFLAVNQAAIVHYGYSESEFLSMTIADIRPPSDLPAFFAMIEQYRLNDYSFVYHGEWHHCKRDGSIIDVEITSSRITWSGKLADFVMVKDITQQQSALRESLQAQTALQKNEEVLQLALAGAKAGLWDWEIQTGKVTWSPENYQLYGLNHTDGNLDYEHWYNNILHPSDREWLNAHVLRVIEQKQADIQLEFRAFHPQLGIRWLLSLGRVIFNDQSEPIRMSGINIDITDRKQAELTLLETKRLLQEIIDNSPASIYLIDPQNKHILVNRSYAELLSTTPESLIGKSIYETWEQKIADAFAANNQKVFQSNQAVKVEENAPHADGMHTYITIKFPLHDTSGIPYAVCGISTDITDKKHLEAQFHRAQRLESLGTLASGISHDLNNILTPILAVAQLLPLKLANLSETNQHLLKVLEDSSKRGAELVKQITVFAKGAEGKRITLQPRHLLKEIERMIKSTFPKSIEICTDIPTQNLWIISADPTQIHQVLMNLCINARDAMPEGGTLTISVENLFIDENYAKMSLDAKVGNYIVITVSDTGCGMSEEVKQRIFEPFFTTKEQGKGTGLGLATVIGIIKNHNGFIDVHSSVDKGSQFKVYLAATNTDTTQSDNASEIGLGNGELILIVDDEAYVRDITKTSLLNYNYNVMTASDAIDAFSLYSQYKNDISLVLMDIQMPSIDGLHTITILQQMNPDVKIIAISGGASSRHLLEINNIKVQAFLSKPYTIKALMVAIKGILDVANSK